MILSLGGLAQKQFEYGGLLCNESLPPYSPPNLSHNSEAHQSREFQHSAQLIINTWCFLKRGTARNNYNRWTNNSSSKLQLLQNSVSKCGVFLELRSFSHVCTFTLQLLLNLALNIEFALMKLNSFKLWLTTFRALNTSSGPKQQRYQSLQLFYTCAYAENTTDLLFIYCLYFHFISFHLYSSIHTPYILARWQCGQIRRWMSVSPFTDLILDKRWRTALLVILGMRNAFYLYWMSCK